MLGRVLRGARLVRGGALPLGRPGGLWQCVIVGNTNSSPFVGASRRSAATSAVTLSSLSSVRLASATAAPLSGCTARVLCRGMSSSESGGGAAEHSTQDMVEQIATRAVGHVETHGWTDAAVTAAVADLGLPTVAAGVVRGGAGLVAAFVQDCNRRLPNAELSLREGATEDEVLREVLVARVAMILPHAASWTQALATLAQPSAVPTAAGLIAETAEAICEATEARTGASTVGAARKARSVAVGTVLGAAELYATQLAGQDPVAAREAVGEFVDRRLGQLNLARAAIPPGLPELFVGAVAVAKNILGINQRRV
eukprot:m.46518 g.46518  ORF g.46518 m.46518 type:complete len:313 (+) comp8774_c0_seq1:60-998(+)